MHLLYLAAFFFPLLIAPPVFAAVSINEVAWMGGLESANHEWIEIYNSGDTAMVVDGWTLKDGMNLNINLTGTIGSNSYAVLERTGEESAPGTAFLTYTGALVNTGATLVLSDASGGVVDQVVGGIDWQNIGGDNTTKETAQYSTTGWVTDEGTPGEQNGEGRVEEVIVDEVVTSNTNSNNSSGSSKKSSSQAVRLKNSETKMTLVTDIQSIAYVNQNIKFVAAAKGLSETTSKLVRFEWNFGDSYVATSTKAEHSYRYPGTYIVTVYARNGKAEQVARHEITVLPVSFSITRNENQDIQINNDAPYDVDISGYFLKGKNSILFSPRTVIVSRGTITIESARLNEDEDSLIALYDNKRNLIASTYPLNYWEEELLFVVDEEGYLPTEKVLGLTNYSTPTFSNNGSLPFNFVTKIAEASEEAEPENSITIAPTNITEKVILDKNENEPKWPYLALICLLTVAVFGIFLSNKSNTRK